MQTEGIIPNYISYFVTKMYVVGAQKKRLIEAVLLSIQHIIFRLIKKSS